MWVLHILTPVFVGLCWSLEGYFIEDYIGMKKLSTLSASQMEPEEIERFDETFGWFGHPALGYIPKFMVVNFALSNA